MNPHNSSKPCGCDPGLNWLCAQHKFKTKAMELVESWRKQPPITETHIEGEIFLCCANELEELLKNG